MMTQGARVIDLNEYRRRRSEPRDPAASASASGTAPAPMVWVPVWVVPVWVLPVR